uniref:tripartite motif-containing protein 16-like n=1 Tax=Semicossyphus pulcher TaxID=241346 RepID=UPI0037E9224A
MSVVEQRDQEEPEVRLIDDDVTNELDEPMKPEDQKVKEMRTKDLLQTSQRTRRTRSPLSLFREDFSQIKEEFLKVFREDKPVSSTLDLLKDDLSQLKEDVTSVFSSYKDKETKCADPKSSQTAEKTMNPLSVLKDDFSSIFRIGLTLDRDTAKEDSSKIKVSNPDRTDERSMSLIRGDQKTSKEAENNQGGKEAPSEVSEEQIEEGLSGHLSETVHTENVTDEPEQSEEDVSVSQGETESVSETQQSEEVIPSAQTVESTAEQRCDSDEWNDDFSVVSEEDEKINDEEEEKEEEEPAKTLSWESLSSVVSLFNLRDRNKNTRDDDGGDLWPVKNFACYLTFDPNTANSELHLTDGNRNATRVWSDYRPSDHPDRFKRCPQLLCREGLLDSAYWEVVWSGGADIGVTYNNISRDGDTPSCLLGHNERSWSLECSEGNYTPCHDNKRFKSSSPRPFTHRVGVYLDWSAGALSFYCISKDNMVHLHTFTSTFSEPLYPGFWVWAYDGSVSLRQVELDWERLLQ